MRARIAVVVGVAVALALTVACSEPPPVVRSEAAREATRAAAEQQQNAADAWQEELARRRAATERTARPAQPRRPRNPAVVSADTWTDGPWPLTVTGGVLSCVGGEAVFLTTRDGRMWPLTGLARQVGARYGAEPAIDPIWRGDPDSPGLRINIGTLIARAQRVC